MDSEERLAAIARLARELSAVNRQLDLVTIDAEACSGTLKDVAGGLIEGALPNSVESYPPRERVIALAQDIHSLRLRRTRLESRLRSLGVEPDGPTDAGSA